LTSTTDPRRRVPLCGEHDLATLPQLRRELRDELGAADDVLLIDCTDLAFIDCAAIGAIVSTRDAGHRRGVDVRVVNASAFQRRVFEIVGEVDLLEAVA
jgi:anti-anti-sigma factor